ncbi:hypothetical protein [Cumulibacter manganitolerans]|uniref:hypothetical protein n=1 Tax=Cumulibacter manganitolerans TaxID=1884992 RepID=UPI001295B85A|nr:hypothetical protein [Cumulibacter manganitolerans]
MANSSSLSELIRTYRAESLNDDPTDTAPAGSEPSWDYCYRWFNFDGRAPHDERRDCLELGYYLANWGMFRGSGVLMRTNLAALRNTISVIDSHHADMRDVDIVGSDDEWAALDATYEALESALPGNPSPTLITKVMLGVWGCVPAMDTYVLAGIKDLRSRARKTGLETFNRRFYDYLSLLRHTHADEIEEHRNADLHSFGEPSTSATRLPAGKILDMYLFQVGRKTS